MRPVLYLLCIVALGCHADRDFGPKVAQQSDSPIATNWRQEQAVPEAPKTETKPEGLGGIEVSGSVKIWGGKILYRAEFGSKIAIDPACCCEAEGLCACISECPDDPYHLEIDVPAAHAAWVQSNTDAECSGTPAGWTGGFLRVSNVSPQSWYELQWTMRCEVVGGQAVWTVTQQYGGDTVIILDGVFYCSYIATKTFTTGCEGGIPPAGIIDDWDIQWDPGATGFPQPDGFPLDIELVENPLP